MLEVHHVPVMNRLDTVFLPSEIRPSTSTGQIYSFYMRVKDSDRPDEGNNNHVGQ
jgi:hypothetical protein